MICMKKLLNTMLVLSLSLLILRPVSADTVTLYAAGSLTAALTEIVATFEKHHAVDVRTRFGPSGLLREAIEQGEQTDVFISANMAHPQRLQALGWGASIVLYAHNRLCALARPGLAIDSDTLLAVLLDKNTRIGTSTPGADPSGDYAWQLFQRAESLRAGSFQALSGKAKMLLGGRESQPVPTGRTPYAWVMEQDQADVFLTYCTNVEAARRENSSLQGIALPHELAVGADYGLLVSDRAHTPALDLARFLLSPTAASLLQQHGFSIPHRPDESGL